MNTVPWLLLDRLSVQDVRRRVEILSSLSRAESSSRAGFDLVRWESGGGDDASWLFTPDGRVLLTVMDHESPLNLYSDYDVAAQASMYDGVPEDLVALVRGLADEDPFLMIGDGDLALPAASGVFWFDGRTWRPSDGLVTLAEQRDLDLARDSGIMHCTHWCLLNQDFTPQTLLDAGAEDKYGFSLDQLTALFAPGGT